MGTLYGGNSITKQSFLLLSGVFCITAAHTSAIVTPNKYIAKITSGFPLKYAAVIALKTGIFALQDIKGVSITVLTRILASSRPLAVTIAVAEHPNPIIKVNAALPLNPIFPNKSSVINATLDI